MQFLAKISQINNKKWCYLILLCNYLFLYIWKHIYFSSTSFCLSPWLCNWRSKNDLSIVMTPGSLKRQLPVLWQASVENNFQAIFLALPERLRTGSTMHIYRKTSRWYTCSGFCLFFHKYVWKNQNLHLYEVFRSQNRNTKHFIVRIINNLLWDMVEFLLLEVLSSKMMSF